MQTIVNFEEKRVFAAMLQRINFILSYVTQVYTGVDCRFLKVTYKVLLIDDNRTFLELVLRSASYSPLSPFNNAQSAGDQN